MSSSITTEYIQYARKRFRLDWSGIHGGAHWARVRRNGLELAQHYDVDVAVVEWFAFTHDLERFNDYGDRDHGARAARLVTDLNSSFMGLNDLQLKLLQTACEGHSGGQVVADPTVMVCWDADRLDLARVGIQPDPKYLCTQVARDSEFIAECVRRSFLDGE